MSDYHFKPLLASRGVTLNRLKDDLCSLNMRMLLAMQCHNKEAQEDIKEQMAAVQAEIDQMCWGHRYRR